MPLQKNEKYNMIKVLQSKVLALTEAGNSALMSSVFHRLAGNFGLCMCRLQASRLSSLTKLAQKFSSCPARAMKLGPEHESMSPLSTDTPIDLTHGNTQICTRGAQDWPTSF